MQFNASIIALTAAIMAGAVTASPSPSPWWGGAQWCPAFQGNTKIGDCQSGIVTFSQFKETDFPGNDLSTSPHHPVQDLNTCQRLCVENNWKNLPSGKCVGVTFNTANKKCFLKSKADGCGVANHDGQSVVIAACNLWC